MLQNFTWADYFLTVILLLAVYYLFVGSRFFNERIKTFFAGLGKPRPITNQVAEPKPSFVSAGDDFPEEVVGFEERIDETMDDEFAEVENLLSQLKPVIETTDEALELKQKIRQVFQEHSSVKHSPFRASINEFVVSECAKYGAVTLSENDVELLWDTTA